jgi:hypothetical protein
MDPVMTIHRNECRETDIAPPGPVARVSIYDGAVATYRAERLVAKLGSLNCCRNGGDCIECSSKCGDFILSKSEVNNFSPAL